MATSGRPFTAQEREIAALLAGRVGFALANARLHQKTRDAAITDPLTGLHNRRHFDATLEREDASGAGCPPSAPDAFRDPVRPRPLRRVNKQYGHQVGDRVLRLFADTLRARARASDLVARYGGEEFVVILDNASREDARRIAEEIRMEFAKRRSTRQRRRSDDRLGRLLDARGLGGRDRCCWSAPTWRWPWPRPAAATKSSRPSAAHRALRAAWASAFRRGARP